MTVFSVDAPNAWSLMTEFKVIDRGRVPTKKDIWGAWSDRWIDAIKAASQANIIGIEGVHIRSYGKEEPYIRTAKQRSALVLQRRAGIIEGLCRAYRPGVRIEIVDTGDWRKTNGLSESWGRDRLKAAAIQRVQQLYGLTVTHDEADAILIGRHLAIAGGTE